MLCPAQEGVQCRGVVECQAKDVKMKWQKQGKADTGHAVYECGQPKGMFLVGLDHPATTA